MQEGVTTMALDDLLFDIVRQNLREVGEKFMPREGRAMVVVEIVTIPEYDSDRTINQSFTHIEKLRIGGANSREYEDFLVNHVRSAHQDAFIGQKTAEIGWASNKVYFERHALNEPDERRRSIAIGVLGFKPDDMPAIMQKITEGIKVEA